MMELQVFLEIGGIFLTTKQLYYLVTIADMASLSNAAQVLEISQPALSKFLTEYENSLGFLLFLRYRRQLTPTAVGRYVIECAQKILDEQTRMLQSLRVLTDSSHSLIRLATAPNRGAIIYSRIYNQFSRKYPDISLSLTELYASEQPSAIQHGQIDIALGAGKTSDKVADLPFAYEELLVSLPISHPLASRERIRLAELKDTPFVLQGPRHSIRILAEELFLEAGFSPVITFESNDVILVDSMLHQAVGAGLVSQAHVFPCEELVYRPLDPPVHQTLHIRYPLGHTLTEPERYLAGLLIRERLSDSRYQANPLEEAEELMSFADTDIKKGEASPSYSSTQIDLLPKHIHHTAPQINLSTPLLKYMIAIVDEKSLTKAAEKFYLSQPALSRYLHNVEDMVCAQLFTRVHNRLQPTNAGKIFVNFARNMLQIDTDMMKHIRTYREGHGGSLYLQCDPDLAPIVRQQISPAFHNLHPDIQLYVVESSKQDTQEALLNASADYGLYFSCEEEHPILDSRIIAESQLVYCFGADDSFKDSFPISTCQSLSALPPHLPSRPVMVALEGSTLRIEQDRLLENLYDSQPSIVCQAQSHIIRMLAHSGAADTILPIQFLSSQALSRSASFQEPSYYYLLKVHHPGRTLPPSVKDLSRLLDEIFGSYFID